MMRVYNSREKKRLREELAERYGTPADIFAGYDILGDGKDVWMSTRECLDPGLAGLRIDSAGLQVMRGGRPTIHGIQLLFAGADLTELDADEAAAFIARKAVLKKGRVAAYRGHPLDLAKESADGMVRAP
jgi:hypothetical protein